MQEYLPAIDELIAHYEEFKGRKIPDAMFSCPLCEVAKAKGQRRGTPWAALLTRENCAEYGCPWTVYEGYCCEILLYNNDNTRKRLKRLKRWKRLIGATVSVKHKGIEAQVRPENHAGRWEILVARLFGKKKVTHVDGCTVTEVSYRGKRFLIDIEGV